MRKMLTFAKFCDLMVILLPKKEATMKRRDFIVSTLVRAGFRTSLKGFSQFCDCVELYLDDGTQTVEWIYDRAAGASGCSKSSVEKNLRRLFDGSDACAAIGKLFGVKLTDAGNKEIIAMFANYVELCRDRYAG